MSVRSILNTFNQLFLICGLGCIKYNQSNLNTTMMFYIWRCTIICCGFKTFYDANCYWATRFDNDIFDITSFVMICFYETIYIGRILSNVWRLFLDNKLSVVLIRLEGIHDKLIRLNVVRPMKVKMHWLLSFGILVHFIAFNMRTMYWIIIQLRFPNMIILTPIAGLISNICACVAFYEYMLLISYIKWMVYIINEQIPKNISTISTFRDLYLEVMECLNDINISIYGLPAIVSYIGANVGVIFVLLFYKVIFAENYEVRDVGLVTIEIVTITIRTISIILLYGIGHATEKEINRMSLVLQQRSIIERNPRIKRQIKFFILRNCHEQFHFKLYGILEINPTQLLILSNKAFAYLVIQILFKLNKNKNQ
ncbi:uncharacterized protein LOC132948235 [Metopolophium dirhodum]|uniref:uncharacterized protein LOC132948235 n=1 Tax=Metopolophium dirhodum TaxID=44670 RepID=UPI00298F9AFA|nr:uncharacterized protein LOC132948235 [Metopolophium dirhodum]